MSAQCDVSTFVANVTDSVALSASSCSAVYCPSPVAHTLKSICLLLQKAFFTNKILVAKLTELTHSTAKRHVESFLIGLIVISQTTGLVCSFPLQPLISENVQRAIKNFTCPVCIS